MKKEKYIICLPDIVANAFIELRNREKNVNELTLSVLEKYGNEVASKLKEDGEKIIYGLSRTATEHFKTQYQNFFTVEEDDCNLETLIILKDGIKIDYLINHFRSYLPLNLLLAYMDDEVIQRGLLDNISIIEKPLVKKKNFIVKK